MMEHACNLALRRLWQEEYCKFEANLSHILRPCDDKDDNDDDNDEDDKQN